MTLVMTAMTPTIETLWQDLRQRGGATAQQRVDAAHPFDIYVDFDPPNRPGLIVVCSHRPTMPRQLKAVAIEIGKRADDRWSIRIALNEPNLLPVFSALCKDIIEITRHGVSEAQLTSTLLNRIENWRSLLEKDTTALESSALRGLIGELTVLKSLMDEMTASEALSSWIGPLKMPQDFLLPSGHRIEVKAVRRNASSVRFNGLDQLDPGSDTMEVVVVRLEDTGPSATDAVTVPILVKRILEVLSADPAASSMFLASLAFAGWHEHPKHHELVVRVVGIERFAVSEYFPKLTRALVPDGILDADYTIALPDIAGPPVSE
jgi:hypothetical protein